MPKIFISYRRTESTASSQRIVDVLSRRYGPSSIFRDVDSIPLGDDFRVVISEAIARSDIVLVLIGPTWTDVVNVDGTKRLSDQNDYVRLEVEAALHLGIHVIPVLLDGASMPSAAVLPERMRMLAHRNAAAFGPEERQDADLERLVHAFDHLQLPTALYLGENLNPVIEGRFQLRFTAGPISGYTYVIRRSRITIGRAPASCDIVLENERAASRTHCSLDWNEVLASFVLDPFHLGGVVVNGVRHSRTLVPLHDGDVLEIGAAAMVYERVPAGTT